MFKLSKTTEQFLKRNYPKFYKYITSKDGIVKLTSNEKLLSLFEKLGLSEKDVVRDYTYRSGAEIKVADKSSFFRGHTPEESFGKIIEVNAQVLDVLENSKTPEEMEAGLFTVAEVLTHEEAHRASQLQFIESNHYTRMDKDIEDGDWLSGQMWGHLNGYWDFQSPSTNDANFGQILLNTAILIVKNQQEEEAQEPQLKIPERY